MKNRVNFIFITAMAVVMIPTIILSQNHLDIEGDSWVKDKLELNVNGPNNGEYIWSPTGLDLRFFTAGIERMRVNSLNDGGDIMIFTMDTITTAQDITASGNVVRLSDGTLALRQYKIGDLAQGGIVLWVDETGEHGLVCSMNDLVFIFSVNHQWSSEFEITGATGDGKGAGAMNARLIVSAQRGDRDSAARLCADLQEGGYVDWYLPSKHELNLMFGNLHLSLQFSGLAGFANSFYWSSSEFDDDRAWFQFFSTGVQSTGDQFSIGKEANRRVRAIRAF